MQAKMYDRHNCMVEMKKHIFIPSEYGNVNESNEDYVTTNTQKQ